MTCILGSALAAFYTRHFAERIPDIKPPSLQVPIKPLVFGILISELKLIKDACNEILMPLPGINELCQIELDIAGACNPDM